MSDFSFNPAPAANIDINLGFWGVLSTEEFVSEQRVGGTIIPNERIKNAIINAAIHVDDELTDKRAQWETEGYSSLSAVSAPEFDGVSKLVILFKTAVFCHAAAELIETHPDISATNDGMRDAGAITPTAAEYRAQSKAAIAKIMENKQSIARLL